MCREAHESGWTISECRAVERQRVDGGDLHGYVLTRITEDRRVWMKWVPDDPEGTPVGG